MPALDTNVLVRYLVKDDAGQFDAASQLITRCVHAGQMLHVPITVTLELEWVLRARYGYGKAAVLQTFSALLCAAELHFDAETALEIALHLYRDSSADFADCLHVALSIQAGETPLWTFDQRAARVSGAQLIDGA